MRILDVNLLLYATNRDLPHHMRAKAWLDATLGDDQLVGLPWVVLLAFLRLSTSARVFEAPLPPEEATQVVTAWLSLPTTRVVAPTERHWGVLRDLLEEAGTAGNLTTDAHLAALAIEHGATLYSADSDFGRFRQLKWRNPLA